MDINQEINKHLAWMETVVTLLGSEQANQQEIDEISRHDLCALGQWLESNASQEIGDTPELAELKHAHEAFHNLAGQLISKLHAGSESEAIKAEEDFIMMSQAVIGHLQHLQQSSPDGETMSSKNS